MGKQHILITGANGFVGRHLREHLKDDPAYPVSALSLHPLKPAGDIHCISADLSRTGWTAELPDACDAVVHLAQSTQHRSFPAGADDMFRVNVQATFELLEWARTNGVKRFILASTANVYKPQQRPMNEDDPCEPLSCYAATKLSAEHLARQYAGLFSVVVCRFFTIYGPTQQDRLIPSIIQRVAKKQPVTLTGGKGIVFSPIYITDAVAYIQALVSAPLAENFSVFNVAGEDHVSLDKMTSAIGHLLNVTPETEQVPGSPNFLIADISRIRHTLRLSPAVGFAEGLSRIVHPPEITG